MAYIIRGRAGVHASAAVAAFSGLVTTLLCQIGRRPCSLRELYLAAPTVAAG